MTPKNDQPSHAAQRFPGTALDPESAFPDAPVVTEVPSKPAAPPASNGITDAPGWLWLALLVFAPWAYGSTRPWTIDLLNVLLYFTLGIWLTSCLVARRWPRVHPVLLTGVGLLLLQGWWMTLNAGFSYDASFQPHARPNWASSLPGAVDYAVARPTMIGLTAMLGGLCLACDLGQHRRWRKRFWLTLALTGVSIVLLGLAQKVTNAPGIFWQKEGYAKIFFGTYRYHANAGAFINLFAPVVAAFLVHSIRRGASPAIKGFWMTCLVLSIAGALANTSRASAFIGVVMLVVWIGWMGWRVLRRRSESTETGTAIAVGLSLVALILTVVGFGGLDATAKRWNSLDQEFTLSNSRLKCAQVCVQMLPQSGWFGFGPGTFRTAFPFFNKDTSDATSGLWLQAHQDYLQTLVEWGWLGAAVWAVLLPGVVLYTAWRAWRTRATPSEAPYLVATLAALGSVLVHAWGDFPLQIASIQLVVVTLVGVLWNQHEFKADASSPKSTRRRSRSHSRSRSRRASAPSPEPAIVS